jgi:hypothetical protein
MTKTDITQPPQTKSTRTPLRVVGDNGQLSARAATVQSRSARFAALREAARAEAEERAFWIEELGPLVSEIQLRYELAKLGDADSLERLKRLFGDEDAG